MAAVAAKAVKEVDYHHDHARMWVLRLGDGTAESHERRRRWSTSGSTSTSLFDTAHIAPGLVGAGVAVDPMSFRDVFDARVRTVLEEATLSEPEMRPAVTGGRRGVHTEQMGYLLAEMQHLAAPPGGDVVTGVVWTGSTTGVGSTTGGTRPARAAR